MTHHRSEVFTGNTAEAARTASNEPRSSSPAWELFKREEQHPGFCIAGCERQISPPKKFLCGDRECRRLFHAIYRRGLRERAKALLAESAANSHH